MKNDVEDVEGWEKKGCRSGEEKFRGNFRILVEEVKKGDL